MDDGWKSGAACVWLRPSWDLEGNDDIVVTASRYFSCSRVDLTERFKPQRCDNRGNLQRFNIVFITGFRVACRQYCSIYVYDVCMYMKSVG